jgi:hypothetical protein
LPSGVGGRLSGRRGAAVGPSGRAIHARQSRVGIWVAPFSQIRAARELARPWLLATRLTHRRRSSASRLRSPEIPSWQAKAPDRLWPSPAGDASSGVHRRRPVVHHCYVAILTAPLPPWSPLSPSSQRRISFVMHAERSVIESRTPRRFIVTDDGRAPESESTANFDVCPDRGISTSGTPSCGDSSRSAAQLRCQHVSSRGASSRVPAVGAAVGREMTIQLTDAPRRAPPTTDSAGRRPRQRVQALWMPQPGGPICRFSGAVGGVV